MIINEQINVIKKKRIKGKGKEKDNEKGEREIDDERGETKCRNYSFLSRFHSLGSLLRVRQKKKNASDNQEIKNRLKWV